MRSQALLALAAATAFLGLAGPASAQDYYDDRDDGRYSCEQIRNGRTAAGAVIGAILGGVIGNNVARHQGDGTVAGAVVGGVAGAAIARDANRCNRPYAEGSAPPPPPVEEGYYDEPYDDEAGLDGGPNERRYGRDGCRWGEMTYYDDRGRRHRERVWMCRDERGNWRPAE
jgi:hypothetical protein